MTTRNLRTAEDVTSLVHLAHLLVDTSVQLHGYRLAVMILDPLCAPTSSLSPAARVALAEALGPVTARVIRAEDQLDERRHKHTADDAADAWDDAQELRMGGDCA